MGKVPYIEGELFEIDDDVECSGQEQSLPLPNHAFDDLFGRLAQSKFRSSFNLNKKDKEYIRKEGLEKIRHHAEDFVTKRLAPAVIINDGKQTPYRGHPVFKAQHATGCCCRNCFEKWHNIRKGTALTESQQQYVVNVLMEWIIRQINDLK
jgi:exodeoxyribonuclease V alpha subunit